MEGWNSHGARQGRDLGSRKFRLIALTSLIVLAGAAAALFFLFPRAAPWTDDWKPPPGFGEMITDCSAGRAEDGQRRMESIFRRYRSAAWRRRAGLALGIARLRRREYAAAEQALGRSENAGGASASFASLKRGQAMIGAGRAREAVELLTRSRAASRDPVLADDFAIALARATAVAGDSSRARQILAAHLSSSSCRDKADVMEAAAAIASAAGDSSDAASLYRKIYLETPRSPRASPALESLSALLPVSSRFRLEDLPAVAERGRTLIAAGDGKGALATWDVVLASLPSAASDPRWRDDIAEAAIEARQAARALSILGRLPVRRGESRRGTLLGRALFASGRDEQAIAALRAASQGGSDESEEALYLLATSLDQKDRDHEALPYFLEYNRRYRQGDHFQGATWRAGWLSYRQGQRDTARRLFQSLLDLPGAAAYHPSALYWLARVEEAERKNAAAVGNYERLVREYTRDYYGLLAARRVQALGGVPVSAAAQRAASRARRPASGRMPLGEPRTMAASVSGSDSESENASEPPRRPDVIGAELMGTEELGRPTQVFCEGSRPASAADRVRTGCELEMIALFQDAEREYEAAAAAESPDRPLLLRLSEIAMRRGDRSAALSRLKAALPDYLAAPIESLPRRYWEVLFPRSDWDSIVRHSREQSLDPALVAGLILQESGFNPLAVSQAGALGLMQVLPSTGADAARALGIRNFTPARLLEPETNIRIGTWHLAGVLARFDRRIELALASYNAGESRVRHWQSVFGTSEPTYFVEEVPYVETRLYVKRVLSHSAMYRAIYGS